MRTMRALTVIAVGVGLGILSAVAGCYDYGNDCAYTLECTGAGSSSSSSSGTGGDGGPPPGCIPSDNNEPVADSCGVFVSSSLGGDSNVGSKDKPFATIGKALTKANGKPIYVCGEAFKEAVTLDAGVTLFGAVDCTNGWIYAASKKTQLTADADAIPLTLTSAASSAEVFDFAIVAADAMKDGGSSIAVVVDQAAVSFTRCEITAGSGKAGLAGMTPMDSVGPIDPNDPSIRGNDGVNACVDAVKNDGALAKENELCPAASGGPLGGSGGNGTVNTGSNGDVNPATTQTALGGLGQPSMDPTWSCAVGQGGVGTNGGSGMPGAGAGNTDLGSISVSSYTGVAGQPGGMGKPGQGGGGGGGAKGKSMCAGASGGSGGAGGCGGHGGIGGQPGGASIGIVSLNAPLTFDMVTLKVGAGGVGGDGGDGQAGATGGKGGTGGNGSANGLSNACDGGNGGQGGAGGRGGGGRGGHALGIAFTGATPATAGVTFTKGTAGTGGAGDTATGNPGDGAAGVTADVQAFR